MTKSDFIVIGGGIAGISAAARLAPLGSVVVLEMEEAVGYHASGRSAAMYEPNYGNDIVSALNGASFDALNTVAGGVLSPRGVVMLARAGQEEDVKRETISYKGKVISVAEAKALVPIIDDEIVAQAVLLGDAQDLDADLLLQHYARECRASGGQIVVNAKADTIERVDGNWQVRTEAGNFSAPLLINAAGAWVDEVAKLAGVAPLGFQPYRRSMARIPAPGDRDVSRWPMILDINETWYAKPDAGKWLVSPAEADPVDPHDAWADDMVLAEGLDRYSQLVTEEVTRLESSWAGLRTFSPDRSLVIGFDQYAEGFFWCGGQGGYGFQSSPAASELVGQLIGGSQTTLDPAIVAALAPERF